MALDPKLHTLAGLAGHVTPEVAFLILGQGPKEKVSLIVSALGKRLAATGRAPSATVSRLAEAVLAGGPGTAYSLAALGARAEVLLRVPGTELARELEAEALRQLALLHPPATDDPTKHRSDVEKAAIRASEADQAARAEAARVAKIAADKAAREAPADDGAPSAPLSAPSPRTRARRDPGATPEV